MVSFRCHLGVVEVSSVYTVEALDVGVALGFDCRPIEGPVDGHIEAILSHVMKVLVQGRSLEHHLLWNTSNIHLEV